jgi:hypothetical protein
MRIRKFIVIGITLIAAVVIAATVGAQVEDGEAAGFPFRHGVQIGRELMTIVTEETGLTQLEIMRELRGGATLAEIITGQGGDVDAVIARVIEAVTERVNTAYEEGWVGPAFVEAVLEDLEERVTAAVNGDFMHPFAGRFPGGMRPDFGRGVMPNLRPGLRIIPNMGDLLGELELTMPELREALRGGESLADILDGSGIGLEALLDEHIAQVEVQLDELLERGAISEERAAAMREMLRERLENLRGRGFEGFRNWGRGARRS